MRFTIVTWLGLLALQALAVPAPQAPAQTNKQASLTEVLMGERADALMERTGEKIVEILKTYPASERSQQMADFTAKIMNPKAGKVADPPGAVSRRQVMPSRSKVAGAQTIKIRYGPYKVPSMSNKNGVGQGGGIFNFPDSNVEKPCEACTIVGMQAGLEFPDGTEAPISKGMWLHHIVLFNEGPGRQDVTCMDRDLSLPHISANLLATNSERIWASGNERTVIHFDKFANEKVGYKVKKEDKFTYNVDLMNDSMDKDVVVYVTTTYDIIPESPKDWDEAVPVWFDITNCLSSEFSPTAKNGTFTRTATWTSNLDGEVMDLLSHLHDGGVSLVLKADGETICDSSANYGETPDYINAPTAMKIPGSAEKHISSQTTCDPAKMKTRQMKKGQKWEITANYDFDKFTPMLDVGGEMEPVMGLSLMYVRVKK
ncbi:hypothetical protein EG328_000266 [Venturia inaequalis]|uniref:Uncharacterized protein n=1 Tax=Venturia inaequalis TaxID=5025 RepID=A0A8H3Z001_VENIN|nr:hypothetical protein EG328_000266 [Venturia inaequalis]RDI77292.1 DNA repair and recombination protein [Venturia inaequalis]